MEHLVWPALLAGGITQAPVALVDNPTWWTAGRARILEDERVYTLQCRGGKKEAKSCWTQVCAVLATHDFELLERTGTFRQNIADDYLPAAGYLVRAGVWDSTGSGARKQGEAGGAHITAPAAASIALDAVVAEAFWLKFAENVLEQLVWPALRAGEITKAPKAHVDNPAMRSCYWTGSCKTCVLRRLVQAEMQRPRCFTWSCFFLV